MMRLIRKYRQITDVDGCCKTLLTNAEKLVQVCRHRFRPDTRFIKVVLISAHLLNAFVTLWKMFHLFCKDEQVESYLSRKLGCFL